MKWGACIGAVAGGFSTGLGATATFARTLSTAGKVGFDSGSLLAGGGAVAWDALVASGALC